MKKFMLVLCVLALSGTCAFADIKSSVMPSTRDIVLLEEDILPPVIDEIAKFDFVSSLSSDKENDVYNQGDKIVLTFKAEADSYLTILDFTPSGQVVVLFPNKWVTSNFVKAGEEVKIPAEGQNFSLRAGSAGVDVVKAIATNKDVEIINPDNQQLAGPFAMLQDPKAGTRDILLFAEEPEVASKSEGEGEEDPLKWSVASLAVMTQGADEEPSGFAAVKTDAQAAKMWTNATNYLTGETVLLKFLSDKPAKLVSLLNIGPGSAENNLLPEGAEISVEPGEILVLPRPDDKWKLVAAGQAGVDVVKGKLAFADGSEMELALEVTVEE